MAGKDYASDDAKKRTVIEKKRRDDADTARERPHNGESKKFRSSNRRAGKQFQEKVTVNELSALLQVESGQLSIFDLQAAELFSRQGTLDQATITKITSYVTEVWQLLQLCMREPLELDVRKPNQVQAALRHFAVPGYFPPGINAAKMFVSKPTKWFFSNDFTTICSVKDSAGNDGAGLPTLSDNSLMLEIDIAIEMPTAAVHNDDYLNGRYFYKRACYLTLIAMHLSSSALSSHVESLRYRCIPDERRRPFLIVLPAKEKSKLKDSLEFRLVVRLIPPAGVLQPKRFQPTQNNVRTRLLTDSGTDGATGVLPKDADGVLPNGKRMKADNKAVKEKTNQNDIPTPHYNCLMLCDVLLEQLSLYVKQSLVAAAGTNKTSDPGGAVRCIFLCKIWLRSRKLYGYILNGFQITILTLYLLQVDKSINALMSAHHCFRVLLNFIIQWSPEQILSFPHASDAAEKYEWRKWYHVVLLDPVAGLLNIFHSLNEADVKLLKDEAIVMLRNLDDASNGGDSSAFQQLFLEEMPRVTMFDHRLDIHATPHMAERMKHYAESTNPETYKQNMLDTMGSDTGRLLKQTLWQVVDRALAGSPGTVVTNRRCKVIWVESANAQAEIDVKNASAVSRQFTPPFPNDVEPFTIWFRFDDEARFLDPIVRGPDAQSPHAKAFREFWGPRCKLTRFSDTSIAEAVVFGQADVDSMSSRRLITSQICRYILHYRIGLDEGDMHYHGGEWDSALRPVRVRIPVRKAAGNWPALGSGEEYFDRLVSEFNKLVSVLKSLGQASTPGRRQQPAAAAAAAALPLQIASVIPISSALQKLDVMPPLPVFAAHRKHEALFERARYIKVPPFVPCFMAHIVLEGSGRWPDDDLEAVQRLKAAFHIEIARALRAALHSPATGGGKINVVLGGTDKIIVDMHRTVGYVFALRVVYPRESLLARTQTLPNGMFRMVRTMQSDMLELELHHKPKLIAALNGVAANHSLCFPVAVRLAKRWMASQLVLGCHVSEEAVELLVASLFVSPAAFDVPRTPDVAFCRFLRLVCTYSWQAMPLIVNFGNKLARADVEQLTTRFDSQRSTLPLVFIATPFDRSASVWTSRVCPCGALSGLVWHRVVQMASLSLHALERVHHHHSGSIGTNVDAMLIFRPPLQSFDVTIHLNAQHVSRRHEALAAPTFAVSNTRNTVRRTIPVLKYQASGEADESEEEMPLVDFDSVACYVDELKSAYDHLALFFYDRYGGDKVYVLWKQQSFVPRPFKPSTASGRIFSLETDKANEQLGTKIDSNDPTKLPIKDVLVIPNVDAILNNFRIIGGELVARVEGHFERWKI